MNYRVGTLAACGVLAASNVAAAEFRALTESCEEALALSALPVELRPRASVYVWRGDQFEKTIDSDGGFHCIVQRNHPDSIIPECVTASGEDSILKGIFVQTKMAADGMSAAEIAEQAAVMVESGEIPGPEEPGVNYMMSAYNQIYNPAAESIVNVGPHTMFFAPNATNAAIGGSFPMSQETKGFPFVVEAGTHSYIVTFTDKAADTGDVQRQCAGQIG